MRQTPPTSSRPLDNVVGRWIKYALLQQARPDGRNESLLDEWVTKVLTIELGPQRDYRARVRRWWKWNEDHTLKRPSVPGRPPEKPAAKCGTLHATSKWGPHYCACGAVNYCRIEKDAATYKVCPKADEVVWVGAPIKRRAGNKVVNEVVKATKSPRYKVGDKYRVDPGPRDVESSSDDADDLWSRLESAARSLLCGVEFLNEFVELLEDKGQVILYGPPGTGKTYFARQLAWTLTGIADDDEYENEGPYSLVQFHPAYSYEDFFEGFRPQVDDDGQMTYELTPGPLVRLAKRAAENPDERHVMVIDEINRANLPRVLGELLYLLEYRDEWTQTQYRPVDGFVLPSNLWIIGTMNTADRSIALIDAAMRRRFDFVPFFPNRPPTQGLLRRWTQKHAPSQAPIADLLKEVNSELEQALGGDHLLIGPSHFMKRNLGTEALRRIWEYNIEPLIEDQLFGQQEVINKFRFGAVWARFGPDSGVQETPAQPTETHVDDVTESREDESGGNARE